MIGFSGGNGFMQRAIKFFINSEFSHSFIVVDGPNGVISALETTDTRVCVTPIDRKLKENNYVKIYDVYASEDDKSQSIEHTFNSYSGNIYGYLSYLWFIWRWFCRLFGVEKNIMWGWVSSGVTCSEVTTAYLKEIYPNIFESMDLNAITPRELYKIITENNDKFICLGWYKK
jgi:hypothetical protein